LNFGRHFKINKFQISNTWWSIEYIAHIESFHTFNKLKATFKGLNNDIQHDGILRWRPFWNSRWLFRSMANLCCTVITLWCIFVDNCRYLVLKLYVIWS
jgi:hypothetical protein